VVKFGASIVDATPTASKRGMYRYMAKLSSGEGPANTITLTRSIRTIQAEEGEKVGRATSSGSQELTLRTRRRNS
jgi:hypothetical protein